MPGFFRTPLAHGPLWVRGGMQCAMSPRGPVVYLRPKVQKH